MDVELMSKPVVMSVWCPNYGRLIVFPTQETEV